MKKRVLLLIVVMLVTFPVSVHAGGGISNGPNSFEVDLICGDETIHSIVPTSFGMTPGITDDGRVAHPTTYKVDYEWDGTWEIDVVLSNGKGFDTVFCTWTWDRDTYLHAMDMHFVPK